MKNICVTKIVGSPFDVDEVMKVVVRHRIPVSTVDYGDLGDERKGRSFELFRITVNANVTESAFKKFAIALQLLLDSHIIEHVHIGANDKVIDIYEGIKIDYQGIID